MPHRAKPILRRLAALFLLFTAQAALAVPIEIGFRADDGSAYGELAFNPPPGVIRRGSLTSGLIEVDGRVFVGSQLYYEFYPIADSLGVFIKGDESTGFDAGDFLRLRFGNPDGSTLELPTRGSLWYSFGGVEGSKMVRVTPAPEPLAAGLFGAGAAALAWRRRRRAAQA